VVNYAENEYFRQAMKSGAGPRATGLRLPKMPQLQACVAFCRRGSRYMFLPVKCIGDLPLQGCIVIDAP
jgi:hypothetical protein